MRDEVLSSIGAQDMDTSSYRMSDLDDVDFHRGIDQRDANAIIRPGIDTPFSPTAFDDLEMGDSAENRILLDEEDDKENSPLTTPVFERPTRLGTLLKSCPFGRRIEKVPDFVFWYLFL